MGEMHPCSMCGQLRDPSERCPRCGNTPEVLAAEIARVKKAIADLYAEDARLGGVRKQLSAKVQAALRKKESLAALQAQGKVKPQEAATEIARLNKSIADMQAEDVSYVNERKKLALKLQAALHQRTLLENAEAQRKKKQAGKPRMWRRRSVDSTDPKAGGAGGAAESGPTPAGAAGVGTTAPPSRSAAVATEEAPASTTSGQDRPKVPRQASATSAGSPRARVAPLVGEAPPPEASPRSMQNLLLALGALLIGIAAIVFAAVALSSIAPGGRLAVLGLATIGLLASAPVLLRKRLSSTAESLATVGLALLPIDGYVIARLDVIASRGISPTLLAGIIFAVTAAVSLLYHRSTRLTSPRYAMVMALQPVLPLLAYDMIDGPAGWALVLTLVAAHDAVIARGIELSRPTSPAIGWSGYRLHELAWVLHGLAVGAAIVYAVASLTSADQVSAAARAGSTLLLATGVGLVGTLMLRRRPLRELASGLLTLAVIGSAARVATVALPERALLVTAAVVALTGLAVRALPESARRGPQLASTLALSVISTFVIGTALRAAAAPVLASLPVWAADLDGYAVSVAETAGRPGWHLAATVALLTVAAALALPPAFRREAAVVGAALTALATPASLGLSWAASQTVLMLAAIGLLSAGILGPGVGLARLLSAPSWTVEQQPSGGAHTISVRCARIHVGSAVAVGAAATALASARPWSTAAVLATFTVAGVGLTLLHRTMPAPVETAVLGDTAAGAAVFAAGAAAGAAAYSFTGSAAVGMASALLSGALALAPVARLLVVRRRIGVPLAAGSTLGASIIAAATFTLPQMSWLDSGVGLLLLAAALLLGFTHSLDANRRADRWLDGADMAAGAVTAAVVAALARLAELAAPRTWLVLSAALVLLVALMVRAMPEELRRGPIAGLGISGGLLGLVAAYPALAGGIQALSRPGRLWAADLSTNYSTTMFGWQAPAALAVLAVAAAIALRPPRSYDAAAAAAVLATVGAPAALGWLWWSPIVLGLAIATVYAAAAVTAIDSRAGYARFTVAVAVALHALGSSLVRGWSTAAALAAITVVCVMITTATVAMNRVSTSDGGAPPSHLEVVGGAGVLGAVLAGPGAFAAVAATQHQTAGVVLTATLAGAGCCLAAIAPARRHLAPYLGWATVGTALTGTLVAGFALLAIGRPGVYAAAAALLIVVAELLRTSIGDRAAEPKSAVPTREQIGPTRWKIGLGMFEEPSGALRWPGYRGATAALAAAAPTAIALLSLTEAIRAAIVPPYDNLGAIWQGPPPPLHFTVDGTAVITAVLLTITAALAAVGFGGGVTRGVSVVVPGLAVTILIMPIGLGLGWAAGVLAALTVFTLCVLSVALTQPPGDNDDDRSIKVARIVALLIGLVAGGAGLAGALATAGMTIFTFGGAVGVGATAALAGRSEISRIMGWLGGAVAAELFVLSVSLDIGAAPQWAAFGVLTVGALLLLGTVTLPRLRAAQAYREAVTVEIAGYAAAAMAVALAIGSAAHVAALLAGWGAVLGITATRPGRSDGYRRVLFWAAGGCEIGAWWLIMQSVDVALPEAYTLPFALIALAIGLLELRRRPHLGSWAAYGPALVAGFGPTVVVVLITDAHPAREVTLLVAGIITLVYGSMRAQRAPVAVGTAVTTITALHALTAVGNVWLAVLIGGIVLIVLGADSERRRRATDRYQQMH